ncbi:hypothetical protein OBBRIDRAFT_757537 [Obba rivulosa]|uniref:Uncharacterized protein n=1 Tax=Obba rivulosa TaxID=1052685 RepID=A0A8E2AT29_9APHY|nr:hypothetical protein OBBRIDRAFT_757537 [Obba rivulosa]
MADPQSSAAWARVDLVCLCVQCVLYSGYVVLTTSSMYLLVNPRKSRPLAGFRTRVILTAYSICLFITTTLYFIGNSEYVAIGLIDDSTNYAMYQNDSSGLWPVLRDTALIVNFWLADSLLIWRAYGIWNYNVWVVALPILVYIANIAVGIALLVATTQPNVGFTGQSVIALGTAFWSISVAMDVIVTLLIAGRLLWYRRKMGILGNDHTRHYIAIAGVFAESAAVYAICGILYIPFYTTNFPIQDLFASLFYFSSSIAPVVIILRVALGATETRKTSEASFTAHTIAFQPVEYSQNQTGSGALASLVHATDDSKVPPTVRSAQSLHVLRGNEDTYELADVHVQY